MKQILKVYRDLPALAAEAARLLLAEITRVLADRDFMSIILAGGNTPRGCYQKLAQGLGEHPDYVGRINWILGDERWVGPHHARSNEGMIREVLLDPLQVPGKRFLSWEAGSGEPLDRARDYARRLEGLFPTSSKGPDLLLLGLGADGHTASLFPGSLRLVPRGGRRPISPPMAGKAAAVYVPHLKEYRLTLTPGFLGLAASIYFLVSGREKKRPLTGVLAGDPALPGSWLNLDRSVFLVTRDVVEDSRLAGV